MKSTLRRGIAGVVLLGGAILAGSTTAGATSGSTGATGATGALGSKFIQARASLEVQLALRATRLTDLSADITGAKSLTTTHMNLLNARVATEEASINALVQKVPNDTTWAELNADRSAMLKDNRVFAVMSPQVFETIEGDAVLASTATLSSQQASLLADVNSLAGDHGYQNALNHYNNFVQRITGITTSVGRVEVVVLAQTPQGYPGNTHFFVNANRVILHANVSLAYASYDASVIALATGGYTGS